MTKKELSSAATVEVKVHEKNMDQPKKPSFKKSFAVPTQKSENENTEPQPKILTDENENVAKKQLPSLTSDVAQKTELASEEKVNTLAPAPSNKIKPKKCLFQAPSTTEIIDKKDTSKQKEKKVKATKKMLKEKSINEGIPEPKKLKTQNSNDKAKEPTKIKTKKTKVKITTKANDITSFPSEKKSCDNKENELSNEMKYEKGHSDEVHATGDTAQSDVKEKLTPVDEINGGGDGTQSVKKDVFTPDDIGQADVKEGNELCAISDEVPSGNHASDDKVGGDGGETDISEKQSDDNKENNEQLDIDIKETTVTDNSTSKELPKSLTDEEYKEIFQAVLDRCENTSLDEMFESLLKPVKVRKQKPSDVQTVNKNSSIKPKITKPKIPKVKKQLKVEAQVVPVYDNSDDEKSDDHVIDKSDIKKEECPESDNDMSKNELNSDEEEEKDMESDEKDISTEMNECQAISELIPDEVISNLQSLSNTVEPNFQGVNETTPEGSEMEFEITVQKTPPPKKSKKTENHSSLKKQKLAPKQLHFPKKTEKEEDAKKNQSKKNADNIGDVDDKKLSKEGKKSSKKKLTMEKIGKKDDFENKEKSKEGCCDVKPLKEKSRKKELQERYATREQLGTWVQCGNKNCSKWRYLPDCEDPSALPELWTCNMNPDKKFGSCEADEQSYDEDEHIFTNFSEGSVVWAKMAGFPWWPAMVEIDPDRESYFLLLTPHSMYPSHYHVVFFDEKVSRAWVNAASIRKFTGGKADDEMNPKSSKSGKGFATYLKEINKAKENALSALDMSVKDRLKNFGFAKRYKGTIKVYNSDSSPGISKPKKKSKPRKRKIGMISNDIIESALEDSIDGNEDIVLKGFEEVLDAMDEETEDDEADDDFEVSEDEIEITEKIGRKKERKEETKSRSGQRTSKHEKKVVPTKPKKKFEIKKPKMFIVSNKEEEMIVPSVSSKSLKFDSDIFTMDFDDTNEDDSRVPDVNEISQEVFSGQNKKSNSSKVKRSFTAPKTNEKTSVKVDAIVHAENNSSEEMEKEETETNSSEEENAASSHNEPNSCKEEITTSSQTNSKSENVNSSQTESESITERNDSSSPVETSDNVSPETNDVLDSTLSSHSDDEDTCAEKDTTSIEVDTRKDEVLPLEQDEQTVPGEESSPEDDDELNLEILDPVEDKHPGQIISHTIAPVTVELAYDSDPFDMEE